jgi:threonine synthase
MKFYSTKDKNRSYSLEEAVLKSLPDDNGLFMPENFPELGEEFFKNISGMSFQDIGSHISRSFLSGDIPDDVLDKIAREAVNFPVPVHSMDENTSVLELFHGPTLAFKDVGARFMARIMAWLNRDKKDKLTILVATSGDTGSAVANGFYNVEGIDVIILYPSGKVSALQEKQLTTLGGNITAIEIKGTFDDCQRLVKKAFLDPSLRSKYRLSSANSINIARLLPQSFYYVEAYKQLNSRSDIVFSVPSGNFGNLTAGLFATRMGLPVHRFVASNNRNDSVRRYLNSGVYSPGETIPTISNAMDVGDPSNFVRMLDLFDHSKERMSQAISAFSFDDSRTRECMKTVYNSKNYILDPHGAVAYLGWKEFQQSEGRNLHGVILETAHPAKFIDVVEETLGTRINLPEALLILKDREKNAILRSAEYVDFQGFLMS